MRNLPWMLIGLMLSLPVHADQASHVHADHAWIRLLPADLPAGAYVTLENEADQPAALTAASTTRWKNAMLHQSSSQGGMARMASVASVTIPAHGSVQLAPGGYHLMLMHARSPVTVGETVSLTLTFADGSTLKVPFEVRPANAVDAGRNARSSELTGHADHGHADH